MKKLFALFVGVFLGVIGYVSSAGASFMGDIAESIGSGATDEV